SFGRVDFGIDRDQQAVVSRQVFAPQQTAPGTRDEYEGFPLVPNPDVEHVAKMATARAEALKQEKLGVTLTGPFKLVPDIESAIGNLMTRAMLESFDADIAVHNVFGGIRAGLPAGELTYGAVFEMFPFDNIVTVHELSGRDLRGVIARNAGASRLPGFAGMRVFIDCGDSGMNVVMHLDDGREITDDDRIQIIANDFLALGGDDVLTLAIPDDGFELNYNMPLTRDVLVSWFKEGPAILSPEDFRSHDEPKWNLPDIIPESCHY
ncbi:MAG: 5'-nucleotidase C-terminal domain-containing protein, partial [Gammaproteobacteria bacterium]|nr:5'-nucleotidase C-terminal domain-containing protein [Gammaproteobacteria bacterium]